MRPFGLVIMVSVLLASALTPAEADVLLAGVFAISKPSGGREFLNPQSVCVDSLRGDVYVADTGNGRIAVTTNDGYGAGGFNYNQNGSEPVGVAVDSKGMIYVTGSSDSHISVYDYKGRLVCKLTLPGFDGEPPVFGRMAVDSQDNLYVVVRNKGMICVLDSKGNLKQTVGTKSKGQAKFEMLHDVAVDSKGKIYALDTLGSPTVQVFDPSGKFLSGFGTHFVGRGNFAHPTSIEVDDAGMIWVTDSFAHVINVFDNQGQFITSIGGFLFPVDLTYSKMLRRLYVLEKNGHRLLGFDVQADTSKVK